MRHESELESLCTGLLSDVTGGGTTKVTRRVNDPRLTDAVTALKGDVETLAKAGATKPAGSDLMMPMMMMMMMRR
jgi:hypothetical protein